MKIFLDTNIIIDLVSGRKPFCQDAGILFQIGKNKQYDLLVSDLTIINTAYTLHRLHYAKDDIYDILTSLLSLLTITTMGRNVINRSIQNRGKDFEDDAQYFSALDAGADYIITRNKKDFPIDNTVLTPQEFFKLMNIVF